MRKAELRQLYKDKRASLTAAQTNRLEDLMLIQFQKLGFKIPAVIMTYAASEAMQEYNPVLVEDYCFFMNPDQQLCYPLVNSEAGMMLSMRVKDDTIFSKSKFGIDEPVNGQLIEPEYIELVLVPLLCFDMNGYRVGYGKGYYDKFLSHCSTFNIKIGFSFFEPEQQIDDINEYDIPLHYCITPERIYDFKK